MCSRRIAFGPAFVASLCPLPAIAGTRTQIRPAVLPSTLCSFAAKLFGEPRGHSPILSFAFAAYPTTDVMRFFRPDNHFLWVGILMTVAVSLYVGTTYFFEEQETRPHTSSRGPAAATRGAADTDGTPRRSAAHTDASPSQEDTAAAATSSTTKAASAVRRRRVRFAHNGTPPDADAPPPVPKPPATPRHVFLDVAKQDFLKDPFVGRVVVELYIDDAPRTTLNFAELCRDKKYVNTPFHRVIKDFMVQGGDIVNQDGTGTYSVFGGEGATFADEPFVHRHDRPGLLSMANSGPNTNGSQFFITTAPAPHLDGKHVVFGRVVQGLEHVHDLEREVTDPNDRPIRKCYVMNSGVTERPAQAEMHASAAGGQLVASSPQAAAATPPAAQALETYTGRTQQAAVATPEPVPFQL